MGSFERDRLQEWYSKTYYNYYVRVLYLPVRSSNSKKIAEILLRAAGSYAQQVKGLGDAYVGDWAHAY